MQNLWTTGKNWLDIIHAVSPNITLHVATCCCGLPNMIIPNIYTGVLFMLLTQSSSKYRAQLSSSSSELGLENVNTVGKDLIGITQSDSARVPSMTWKLKTQTTPSSNKQLQKSRVKVHLLNSLCNSQSRSREMISELHTSERQQILRSSGTKHHKFDWGLCHVTNQTQGWGTLEKYMICCFKSTAVMFFNQQNSWTTYWAVSTWHWWESTPSLIF